MLLLLVVVVLLCLLAFLSVVSDLPPEVLLVSDVHALHVHDAAAFRLLGLIGHRIELLGRIHQTGHELLIFGLFEQTLHRGRKRVETWSLLTANGGTGAEHSRRITAGGFRPGRRSSDRDRIATTDQVDLRIPTEQ